MRKVAECPKCNKSNLVWVKDDGTCPHCSELIDPELVYNVCSKPRRKQPTDDDLREAIKAVDEAWHDLVRARSIIPYPGDNAAGSIRYFTPPFYRKVEPILNSAVVSFERPLSDEDVKRIESAGHSVNEGYVLRLNAILEVKGLLQVSLDRSDEVERHIWLVRELRNKIAHGKRKCKPGDKTLKKLNGLALIEKDRAPGEEFFWPLSISDLLKPLTEKVKEFIKRFLVEGQGRT